MFKRILLFVFIIVISAAIMGCGRENEEVLPTDRGNDTPHTNNGKDYISTNSEVIEIHGRIENFGRLNDFVDNVQGKIIDKIRLVRYTTEGAPIYHDLDYNGSNLTFTLDTTKDMYGQGEVNSYDCKSIQRQETNTETKYSLEGCPNSQMSEILFISHDVDKEDYFAFELKYGVDKKNEIDTRDQELIKDLQNGETVVVSDFQFSKEEMNKIYKLMVFSNYLEEKELSKACNQKPYESYELNVWINSANRNYEWGACDHSEDGKEMTTLILNILKVLNDNPTYQSLPSVEGGYE